MNELSINIIQQQWKNRTYSTRIGVVKYRYMINLGEIKLPTLMQWGKGCVCVGGGGVVSGADPGFQVRGGAKIFVVFRVKNHDFTPKNHIFSNFRGEGGRAPGAPPPPPPEYGV